MAAGPEHSGGDVDTRPTAGSLIYVAALLAQALRVRSALTSTPSEATTRLDESRISVTTGKFDEEQESHGYEQQ